MPEYGAFWDGLPQIGITWVPIQHAVALCVWPVALAKAQIYVGPDEPKPMLVVPVFDGVQPPESDVQEVIVGLGVESEMVTVVAGPVYGEAGEKVGVAAGVPSKVHLPPKIAELLYPTAAAITRISVVL
jgi:hypothetical protein